MDLTTLVGTQLGDYHLKRVLGRGGMGAVFLGWHMHMQLPFAVKVLRLALAENEKYLKRFFHEAHQGARLKHENIVTVHNAGMADVQLPGLPMQLPYLAMEYVEGKDIFKVMKGQPGHCLKAPHAVEIVMQALRGLAYAHGEGMIHRDIKPENLLLTPANVVRIADFGLARGSDKPVDAKEAGAVMGTPEYMPIEQWQGRTDIDHRVDIYAMGASLYHMLAGQPPFPGRTPIAILKLVHAGESQAVEQVAPDVDPMLSSVVHKMMAREPEDRYPTAQAALDELTHWRRLYEEGTLPGMRTASSHAAGFDLEEIEAGADKILQGDLPALLPADEEASLGPTYMDDGDDDEEGTGTKLKLQLAGEPGSVKPARQSQRRKATARVSPNPAPARPTSGTSARQKAAASGRPSSQSQAGTSGRQKAQSRRGSSRPASGSSANKQTTRRSRPSSSDAFELVDEPSQRGRTFNEMPHLHNRNQRPASRIDFSRIVSLILVVALIAGGLFVLKQFGCEATGQAPPPEHSK